MSEKLPLKVAIVAGEESGDLLGADLVDALRLKTDRLVNLIGVGGNHLQERGLKTLFDPDEIALMGLSAVLMKLPKLMLLINRTAKAILAEKPDILIIIDSPDFTHRVASKVRQRNPSIPILKYIAPTVWAWRPQRAKEMRRYIDHVLTVLPFEVEVMEQLAGPNATYVGHRLSSYKPLVEVAETRKQRLIDTQSAGNDSEETKTILLLPGSRRSEIHALLKPFGDTIEQLVDRIGDVRVILPTLARHEATIRHLTESWAVKPQIVIGEAEKWKALSIADAALAASGTVSLELALARVPMVIAYKADWFTRQFLAKMITIWSASLPNIIDDSPVIPEFFNDFVRPGMLARQLEQLLIDSPARQGQLAGFDRIAELMKTDYPAGEIAAQVVIDILNISEDDKKSKR